MNHFDGLPDELLIFIISKIDDLKSVCRCTIVSKRFASHTCNIQSVTVRLPGIDEKSLSEDSDPCRLSCSVGDNDEWETLQLIWQQSIHLKLQLLKFLEKFTKLESVTLEVACPRSPCTTPLLKWALKFLGSGAADSSAMAAGLVFLLPTSILEDSDEDEENDEVQHTHVDVFDLLMSHGGDNALLFPLLCREWLVVLTMLIKRIHSIRRVTCMDAEKHGSFKLGDEQLAGWRRRLLSGQFGFDTYPRAFSIGWVPDLRLPRSGIRMKGVLCVFVDFQDELYQDGDYDPEVGFEDGYPYTADPYFFKSLEYDDGEEKVMGEAVNEIVDKHWNMVKCKYIVP